MYYFHAVLGIAILFTHFSYVPIIFASLWWKRKGLSERLANREEALRESEEKYRTILEGIQDGYYEANLKGDVPHSKSSQRLTPSFGGDWAVIRDSSSSGGISFI